jgi:hypothetical protein
MPPKGARQAHKQRTEDSSNPLPPPIPKIRLIYHRPALVPHSDASQGLSQAPANTPCPEDDTVASPSANSTATPYHAPPIRPVTLPGKLDSNIILAGSVLVVRREQVLL